MATFKVTFKESYMPHEVERTCVVPSEKDGRMVVGFGTL